MLQKVTGAIALRDVTLELTIKTAKQGSVHRMMYASMVGLLQNKTACLSSHLNDDHRPGVIANFVSGDCPTPPI